MIHVQLKAKHYFFIANTLKDIVASQYFGLLNRIKAATVNVQDDDLVTVAASVGDTVTIYAIHTAKPEGQVNVINTEMSDLLAAQIQANITDPEWAELAQRITEIRTANLSVTGVNIQQGKEFLHG